MKDGKDKWRDRAKDLNEQERKGMRKFPGLRVRQSERCLRSTGTHVTCLHFSETPAGNSPIWGKSQSDTCTHTVVFGVLWVLANHDVWCFFVFKSPNLVLFGSNTEWMWYNVIISLPFLIKFLISVKYMIYYVSDDSLSLSSLLYFLPRCHCLLATLAT